MPLTQQNSIYFPQNEKYYVTLLRYTYDYEQTVGRTSASADLR